MNLSDLERISPFIWKIPRRLDPVMKTDGEIFGSEGIVGNAAADASLQQVINVAALPGIVGCSLAMPDIHYGYGFCIGGVAAFSADSGIVLPGGVGYDINCGVRLVATAIPESEAARVSESLGLSILKRIPTGLTDKSNFRLDRKQFFRVLQGGAAEIVRSFSGREEDLAFIESGGRLEFAAPEALSSKAVERGLSQVGSLGSGNHFIEIQVVDEIYDEKAAASFGLQLGQTALLIHTGSRGFGHQIATDYIETFRRRNLARQTLKDPQLIHAAIQSAEGRNYLQALSAASNFAWANRHLLMEEIIAIFEAVFRSGRDKLGMRLVYDQAHNIAKFETHRVAGSDVELLVHRKGATRAFPAGHPEVPESYRQIGQPVLIPGSMGTCSYVLRGTEKSMELTFGSSAHGAGRRLSRHQAVKLSASQNVRQRLREKNIQVFSHSSQGLREEIPEAYKDVDEVVETTVGSGISAKVARLRPLVVIKG